MIPTLNKIYLNLKKYKLLLLSHHPECDKFKNHTIRIGSVRLCIGCFIGYPTSLTGIFFLYISKIYMLFNSTTYFLFGITFLSFFILSPLNLAKKKVIKIIQKFCIGLGSVFLFWWIWTLSTNPIVNLLNFMIIFGLIIGILNGYHAYSLLKTCKKCIYASNWKKCPGFHTIYNEI